jgi:hypothetical protein
MPPVDTSPVPEVTLSIDNVSREIMRHLDAAVISQSLIDVTYRPYLTSDLEGPQIDPAIHLVLSDVEADVFTVSGKARIMDIGNKTFPSIFYTAKTFPSLAR